MPRSASTSSMPGAYAHSGSQNPAGSPKRRSCERRPASTWRRRPASVASLGRTACVAADAISAILPFSFASWKARRGSPPSFPSRFIGGRVMIGLRLGGGSKGPARVRHVAVGGVHPVAAQEAEHPLPHAIGLQLVREHRGDRHREALRDVQDGKVRARERVEEPLLAERIGSEPLHVRHVRVEDDREIAGGAVGHLSP